MKKQLFLTLFLSLTILFCFCQNFQNEKVYLKKYVSNNVRVEIVGFNKNETFTPHGKVSTFFSNNQIALEGEYNNGLPIGKWILYYENGNIKTSATYENGLLNGLMKTFYDDGQLASVIPYDKNSIEGNNEHYDRRGQKTSEITYKKKRIISIRRFRKGKKDHEIFITDYSSSASTNKNNLKFHSICFYGKSSELSCLTTNEFIQKLISMGYASDFVMDILERLQKAWTDFGLKGNVLVQCANGMLGVSDIGSPGKSKETNNGIPDIGGTGSSSFRDKVNDACSDAMINGKLSTTNTSMTGNGVSLVGPGGKSPKQDLIDKAVAKMDKLAGDCTDGGKEMIQINVLGAWEKIKQGLKVLSVVADVVGIESFAEEKVGKNNGSDVNEISQGEYEVAELDGKYKVLRTGDGTSIVEAELEDGIQTCVVDNGSVKSCSYYYTNLDGEQVSGSRPANAKTNKQILQAAKDVDCDISPASEGCAENALNHPKKKLPSSNNNIKGQGSDINLSKCDQIKGAWARLKAECEKSSWQTKACIEMVYFMNGCPIDITVTDPTEDGGLYFGCSQGDAEVLKKACDNKKLVQNNLPDGPVSQSECLNPSDITKIQIGFDHCGPEIQPTDVGGCNPPTNVPSETDPMPSPINNPIAAPLFKNNQFRFFGEYVQHNQYMRKISISDNNKYSSVISKQVNDKNIVEQADLNSGNSIVVFYSNSCQPSLNFLSEIQKNLKTIETKASIYVTDVEQNPELRRQYNIQYTPTTVILKNGKATKIFSGAGKLNELLNLR